MDITALKSLKNILKFSMAQKFADYTLDSGAVIRVEGDLVVGTAVSVVNADGSTSPAPDAVHVIEGVAKVKTEGGIITEIMPIEEEMSAADPAEAVEQEQEMSSDNPAETAQEAVALSAEEVLAMMEAKMAEMDAKVSEMGAKLMEMEAKMSSLFSANFSLIEVVDELSKKPTAEPSKPNYFNAFKPVKTAEDKLNRLLEISKGFNN
jgi:hypothetical protein